MTMSSWKKHRLEDLIDVKHGYAFKGEYFSEAPTKNILLTPGNFNIGGGFKTDKFKYYRGEIPKDYILKEDDIIISMTDLSPKGDTLGTTAKVPSPKDVNYLHNQRLGLVIFKSDSVYPNYLYWALRINKYHNFIVSSATGSTVRHTSPSRIKEYELNLPSLPEQTAIASILSSLDDKIELNLQTNKTLEEMANALYKHWFVDFGPFQKGKFVESELGMIPEGWEVKLLSSICDINTKTLKPFENPDEEYCHYSLPSFDSENIALVELGSTIASNKTFITEPTILVSKLNPRIRRVWTVIPEKGKISISSTEFMNYVPKQIYQWGYLNCFFRTDFFFEELLKQATGTSNSHQRAQPKETLQIKIILPDKNNSIKFNELVSPLFERIEMNFNEIVSLKQTRDYLLPKLISGEIRVKDAERKVKEMI